MFQFHLCLGRLANFLTHFLKEGLKSQPIDVDMSETLSFVKGNDKE